MNRQEIEILYDYNAWANTRSLDAAAGLEPEAFLRDLKNSFPSVRDTLAHILNAEHLWLRRWKGNSPRAGLSAADYPAVESLRDQFAKVGVERRAFLSSLGEDALTRPFTYQDLAGTPHSLPLVHTLQHVVNHGSYHRGQVTTMLRQLGAKPISTDMSRFYLERVAR
jgi:uncharacterized damage-inducible protein DinB